MSELSTEFRAEFICLSLIRFEVLAAFNVINDVLSVSLAKRSIFWFIKEIGVRFEFCCSFITESYWDLCLMWLLILIICTQVFI